MELSILFLLVAPFGILVKASVQFGDDAPADYNQLFYYANIASIAYCLKKDLSIGKLGSENTNCPLNVCLEQSYRDIEIIKTFNFNEGDEVGSGYYAIDREQKRILLVFRGTSSTREWLSDFDIVPVKYEPVVNSNSYFKELNNKFQCKGCKVHRGFYNSFSSNCITILQDISNLKEEYKDYQLVIVGHSLGAALAILTGIEFQLMGYEALVISYASPKVGNKAMMEFVDKIFFTEELIRTIESKHDFCKGYIRLIHKNDFVPKLPPSPIFKHGGYEYYINKKNLPHHPIVIERQGSYLSSDESVNDESTNSISPSKLWPEWLGKYEHTHYFIQITGCDDRKD